MREPGLAGEACLVHGVGTGSFFFHAHQVVFHTIWELVGAGCGAGPADVYAVLRDTGEAAELDAHSPALWLADVWEEDPTGAWCDWSCEAVRRCAVLRDAIHRANEVLRDAYDGVRETEWFEAVLRT